MNKSQELAVMKLRAKIKVEETMKQHQQAWHGKDPVIVEASNGNTSTRVRATESNRIIEPASNETAFAGEPEDGSKG